MSSRALSASTAFFGFVVPALRVADHGETHGLPAAAGGFDAGDVLGVDILLSAYVCVVGVVFDMVAACGEQREAGADRFVKGFSWQTVSLEQRNRFYAAAKPDTSDDLSKITDFRCRPHPCPGTNGFRSAESPLPGFRRCGISSCERTVISVRAPRRSRRSCPSRGPTCRSSRPAASLRASPARRI